MLVQKRPRSLYDINEVMDSWITKVWVGSEMSHNMDWFLPRPHRGSAFYDNRRHRFVVDSTLRPVPRINIPGTWRYAAFGRQRSTLRKRIRRRIPLAAHRFKSTLWSWEFRRCK